MAEGWDISTATFNRGAGYFGLSRETPSPQEVFFKPDGTKMYVAEDSSGNILEYDLSSAWDVSTATYLRGFGTYVPNTFSFLSSLFFKPDGTKMYAVDDYYDDLREYDLSTPWDVSSASYNQEFYLGGGENQTQSIFFKPDGTKLYVVGYEEDAVHEYDLSVAWDISTATLLQTFSVSAQETTPTGLFFKPDGTKMYITGTTGDDVNEYDLSVAWDVSTATYLQNFSVSGQDSIPAGVTFKSDGTKMYISGVTNDAIWEYDLSVAWDVSTATFPAATENYFSVSAQSSATEDVTFKPDGTKMYVLDAYAGLFEYDLSSAWDITSASYLQTLDITTVNSRALATVFKPDGTKMYVVDYDGEDINQYDLSSAWDISTATYLQNFSVSGQERGPTGLAFKPDGTKMYIVGGFGDEVNEYDLSTPWDITTAVYLQNFSVSSEDGNPLDLVFKPDGTKMYITGFDGEDVNEYGLSTPWDISTASYSQRLSFAGQSNDPRAVVFKPDGTKMYMVDNAGNAIFAYDLDVIPEPAAWNVAGLSGEFGSYGYFSVAGQEASPTGAFFKPDGTKMYITGAVGDDVNEYDLSSAWDISTATYVQTFSVSAQDSLPQDVFFKSDGTKMYTIGWGGDAVNEYDLSSAWDISTASYLQTFSVRAQDSLPQDVFFKSDGTKMYVLGDSGNDVNEYDLSSAWDISTATYLQTFSVSGQEASPTGLFFKPDGTKMYITGWSGDDVNEYDLSSPWDISTAAYVQRFAVGSQTGEPTAVSFKPDGTKMYVLAHDADVAFEYDLSTPWDVSTAVWRLPTQDIFSVSAQDTDPSGVFFKPDGTKMYVAGTNSLVTATDAVHEYDLGTAWDVTTATYLQSYDPPGLYPIVHSDVHFKPDGTKMFITDNTYRLVYAYSLSTPWDISTASYSEGRQGALSEAPESVFFKPDGMKMYVASNINDSVWQYSLSTPWDVSTATIINYIGISYREATPTGLSFKPDGTKMYITGSGDDVIEYDLGTPWDTATASFALRRPLMTVQTDPTGLFFKPDGNEVFVVGARLDAVLKYTLLDGGISVTLTGVESQMSVDSVTLSLGASVTVAGLSSTLTVDNATIYLLTPVTVTGVEGRTTVGKPINWGLIVPNQTPDWTVIEA